MDPHSGVLLHARPYYVCCACVRACVYVEICLSWTKFRAYWVNTVACCMPGVTLDTRLTHAVVIHAWAWGISALNSPWVSSHQHSISSHSSRVSILLLQWHINALPVYCDSLRELLVVDYCLQCFWLTYLTGFRRPKHLQSVSRLSACSPSVSAAVYCASYIWSRPGHKGNILLSCPCYTTVVTK